MTWLFTQVWLWSLAAFVLGSLITWLLFVRPVRRRLKDAMFAEPELAGHDEQRVAERTALDLLNQEEPYEEPLIGDWERTPRAWGTRPAEAPAPQSPEPEAARSPDWEIPEWAGSADAATREVRPVGPVDTDTDVAAIPPVDDSQLRLEEEREQGERREYRPDSVRAAQLPTAPPELNPAEAGPAEPGGSNSTWFQQAESQQAGFQQAGFPAAGLQKAESQQAGLQRPADRRTDLHRADPQQADLDEHPEMYNWSGESEPTGSVLSGQLRSLFDPLPSGEEERADAQGVGETQHIPRIEEPPEDVEPTPLPRRTPGVGPRPGAQNLNGSKERDKAAKERDAGAKERDAEPGQREGYVIKGHFASRQYHTPDSPQYDRVVAEVWFRNPADAEQAGFEPWDGRGVN